MYLFDCDQVNNQLIHQVYTLLRVILDVQPASTHICLAYFINIALLMCFVHCWCRV